MVDDSHAVGFMGRTGRGTPEHCGVMGRVDILTGTLGKALGGASGGYTSGRREIVELLRQRSRPYLFSNTLAPSIAGASLKVLELLSASTALRDKLEENTRYFRAAIVGARLQHRARHAPDRADHARRRRARAGASPRRCSRAACTSSASSYPVVPQGKARIRTQISAAHSREDLEFAVEQFRAVKEETGDLNMGLEADELRTRRLPPGCPRDRRSCENNDH